MASSTATPTDYCTTTTMGKGQWTPGSRQENTMIAWGLTARSAHE